MSLVIGIGTSAGGIEALRHLFSQLKDAKNLAFVIVQHLEASGSRLAVDSIRTLTKLPVREISNNMTLQPGTVFVAPAHSLVSLESSVFKVELTNDKFKRHTVIDSFFRAMATDQEQKSVGILLSGEGFDGVQGLKAISEAGGMTIVQDPNSAKHPSMPEGAISCGAVDHVLDPEQIPAEIASYEKHIAKLANNKILAALKEQVGSALKGICEILAKQTHHDFKHYKSSTIVRRILRRMQVLQIATVENYVERLQNNAAEAEALFKELLINVTSFFRDADAWENLRQEVLAKSLQSRRPGQKYRVWVAGCSTGEEVYTMAILIKEELMKMKNPPEVQIIATDIDEIALNIARKGSYPLTIAEHVSPERLSRFFVRKAGRYIVTKELRELCLFSSHNLINDPPFSQLDLISCRNVLIYLGLHLQKKLIPVFHYALRPDGSLFLGTSESLSSHKELFRPISAKYRIAQRKMTAIRLPADLAGAYSPTYAANPHEPPRNHEADIHLISQRIMLDEFSHKYAVVNDSFQVVSVSSGIHLYLDPSEGSFQNNIVKLVRPSLRIAVRSTLNEAKKFKRKVEHDSSTMTIDDHTRRIGIIVQPMPQLGDENALFMIVFKDLGRANEPQPQIAYGDSKANATLVEQLEKELSVMRDDLDKTIQDLESSNEELKSSNEELLSMNEELQSANEELETSKEDIQVMNDALQKSNSDLENLLASTQIATLFLDDQMRISNFTPAITQIYDIMEQDRGRSILNFSHKTISMPVYPNPKELQEGKPAEAEVLTASGQVFLRRVTPYKTHDKRNDGVVVTFIDISELRRTEGIFQTLSNTVSSIIWTTNAEGQFDYFNERWYDYTGLSPFESYKSGWVRIMHPDDYELTNEVWNKSLRTGQAFRHDCRFLRKSDQTYRWFTLQARPVENAAGNITKWCGTGFDIHDQKLIQAELGKRERWFRELAESMPQIVWTADPDGSINYINDRWTKYTGQIDPMGWTWLNRVHPEDVPRIKDTWKNVLRNNTDYQMEIRVRGYDDSYRWFLSRAVAIRQDGGPITQWFGTHTDIHDQKKIESQLMEQETYFRTLVDQAPVKIWITDSQGYCTYLSKRWYNFTGRTSEQDLGFGWVANVHPEDRQAAERIFMQANRTRTTFVMDYKLLRHDGQYRWVSDMGHPRFAEDGTFLGFIGTVVDIHERKITEMKLAETATNLERATETAEAASRAKSAFLTNMSHEIRTPLAAIVGFTDLLNAQNIENTDARHYVDRIGRNAHQLRSLIDELLDLSKIEANKLEIEKAYVDLKKTVDDAFAAVALKAREKGLQFEEKWLSDVPARIHTDPTRLRQILINLVGNAVKFTSKGKVEVQFKTLREEGRHRLEVRIIDTGIGMRADQAQKIFEPFVQADSSIARQFGGTGLGLSLSLRLARLMGGDLWVERTGPGEGSIFVLTIDIGEEKTAGEAPARVRPLENALQGSKILIVDDSADNQMLVRLFLEKTGAECQVANNGEEAVSIAREFNFDLILMDLQMPIMDGFTALSALREQGFQKPIVAFTAHAFKSEQQKCIEAGFNGYVTKPIDRTNLIQVIGDLIAPKD